MHCLQCSPHLVSLTQNTNIPASDPTPSFALMDIQGTVLVTYVYQLVEGEVRVEKMEYRKPENRDAGNTNSNSGAANSANGSVPRPAGPQPSTSPWS